MGNSRRQGPHERHTFGFDEPFWREISLVRSFREQFFESLSVAERLVLGFFPFAVGANRSENIGASRDDGLEIADECFVVTLFPIGQSDHPDQLAAAVNRKSQEASERRMIRWQPAAARISGWVVGQTVLPVVRTAP